MIPSSRQVKIRSGAWVALALFSVGVIAARADDAPAWVRRAAAAPAASYPADVPAEVLWHETIVTIDASGRATREYRRAVRILNRAGISEAGGTIQYLDKNDRIHDCEATLLRGGKVVKSASGNKWMDWSAAADGAIYDETRAKIISFRDEAVAGDIFACEGTVDGPLLFAQDVYIWRDSLPTVVERLTVVVPKGWTVESRVHGATPPAATVSPDRLTWTWELHNQPFHPHEPWSDPHDVVEAAVLLNFTPPAKTSAKIRSFQTWQEVADWDESLNASQCDSDAAMTATVHRLVQGCSTDVEKIRALTSYVQKLRYVAINRDLARGMGYRPRKASEVHSKGFGDCKDKSNLLRAMLREAGVQSYMVSALIDDARGVYADWPSPYQFNHAILAIKVDDKVDLPTVVPTKAWGPLLFFDATDANTLVGDLPALLQGSSVQVEAPGSTELVRLPELPLDYRWRSERRVSLTLSAKGTASGECRITGFAQRGAQLRRTVRELSAKQLQDWLNGRINATIRGATARDITSQDDVLTGKFGISFGFPDTAFAQMLPGNLAVVRLDVLNRDAIPTFAENERQTAIDLKPWVQDDEVVLTLPTGFRVEELPAKTALSSPYGSYESSFTAKDDTVIFRRRLALGDQVVPAAEYSKLKQFLSSASKADRGAVILKTIAQ